MNGAPAGKAKTRFRLSGIRKRWPVATISLLSVLLGYALLMLWQKKQSPPPAGLNQPIAQPVESELGPPAGEEVRILAGEGRSFVDHAGKLWNADTWFEGGTAVKSSVQNIWRTQNPDFYRTSRQGSFRYTISLKKGIYELRLHFAETVYDPESTGTGGEGSRLMTVRANGKSLLTRFDVVADAGASRTADVKVFTDIQPAADGQLHLEFTGEEGKQAILSAIEILPGYRGHIRPVRVLARQTPYYSNDSHWWSPDARARVERQDLHRRVVHFGQRRDGQLLKSDDADQQDRRHQQRCRNRPEDERPGRTHPVVGGAGVPLPGFCGEIATLVPSCSLSKPSVTSCVPGSTPVTADTPFSVARILTVRD